MRRQVNLVIRHSGGSSLSLFYHEPDPAELPPDYCDRRITYLKVAATITSQHMWGGQASVLDQLRTTYEPFVTSEFFEENVLQVYPCLGALVHVAVYPGGAQGVDLHDYPYIAGFQPRKREMYETITESGEMLSQSATQLNVSKSATSTNSQEDYDLELGGAGWNFSGVFGLAQGGHTEQQHQIGEIKRTQQQKQDVRNTDASREKREAYSFTTNVNQIYSLLSGLHLGTNRAVFVMAPRPHIQNPPKFTFARGLRKLEGIQEFFLIINRPKAVRTLCFEVALETAHAHMARAFSPRLIPRSTLYQGDNLSRTPWALGLDTTDPPIDRYLNLAATWNSFPGWVRSLAQHGPDVDLFDNGYPLSIWWLIEDGQMTDTEWDDLVHVAGLLPEGAEGGAFTEDVAVVCPAFEFFSGKFFVAGRRLTACATLEAPETSSSGGIDSGSAAPPKEPKMAAILAEKSEPSHLSDDDDISILYQASLGARRSEIDFAADSDPEALSRLFMTTLVSSLSSPERASYGSLSSIDSEITLDALSNLLWAVGEAGIQDRLIEDVPKISRLATNEDRALGVTSVVGLATLATRDIARSLGLSMAEAAGRRRSLLLGALEALDPATFPADVDLRRLRAGGTIPRVDAQTRNELERGVGVPPSRRRIARPSGYSRAKGPWTRLPRSK